MDEFPMYADSDATMPRIRSHPSRKGIQIVDPIQDTQFSLLTPEQVDPIDSDTENFYFPADTAATIVTDKIETPYLMSAWVRDDTGTVKAEVSEEESASLPTGQHNIELATTQAKVQLVVESAIQVESFEERVQFQFDGDQAIQIGVRSVHEEPAATVKTTNEPKDIMAALSTLGSALKTTSCERSFPTLRGHPPLIEQGDALSIPNGLDIPETGLTIEVPPVLDYIYPVAPLAYYLGARIKPGTVPRLIAEDWEYPLETDEGFEQRVADVLKQIFLLDCVTRTEGYYQVDLHERQSVEESTCLDFERLYETSIKKQIRTYLDVPAQALSEVMPTWKLTADIQPESKYVSAIPFLANELACVRCPESTERINQGLTNVSEQVEAIFRNGSKGFVRGGQTETKRSESSTPTTDLDVFRSPAAESIEQVYVGDGIPIGASKMTIDAYYQRLEYEPSTDPQIRVSVVCNDERMADENVVSEIYGTRDWIQFDISFEDQLSTTQLEEILRTDTDFLHYIGHVDPEGIRCTDGYLDTRGLDEVNISAFLLNACDSYEQGRGLVDNGAMAGIATVTDIVNQAATSVGRTVAKLLNQGFSLASTIPIIEEYEQIGHHYIAVGDGSTSIVETRSGTPQQVTVREDGQEYKLSIFGYPNLSTPMGTVFRPRIDGINTFYINSGKMDEFTLSQESLMEFLNKQEIPVEMDGVLQWSSEITSI